MGQAPRGDEHNTISAKGRLHIK